jgi:hypothetical protein
MKLHEFASGVKLITLIFEIIIDNGHKLRVHNYVSKRNNPLKCPKKHYFNLNIKLKNTRVG